MVLMMTLGAEQVSDMPMLAGTLPLTTEGDLGAAMVAGIDRFLMRELEAAVADRAKHWRRDLSSHEAYVASVAPNRARFARIIGADDARGSGSMEVLTQVGQSAEVAQGGGYAVYAVRWPVLDGVDGEGLLLVPAGEPAADVVALPDCDCTPEMLVGLQEGVPAEGQFARRLAECGCRVLVPMLLDRRDTYSGNPAVRMTNQPHREFVYRAAFEMGRHIIGYEVQKVLAGVDQFVKTGVGGRRPIGVMGYGEGGLVALYAAAVDTRIDAVAVSGYFQPREGLWGEPIYRNVWALLHDFGDAGIASLIAPRALIVEASRHPEVSGPPAPSGGRSGAAPGTIATPDVSEVEREVERARGLLQGLDPPVAIRLVENGGVPGNDETLSSFFKALDTGLSLVPSGEGPRPCRELLNADARMKRQFDQLIEHTQYLMRQSPVRRKDFWAKADASSVEAWQTSTQWYRDYLWDEVIGRLPKPSVPHNARTRQVFDEPKYRGYEVMLDVYPDVFAYGLLLVPKGIEPGERRPVVVCQHGLEGTPHKAADPNVQVDAYNQYGCRLAERGFVVYAPQNPYLGGDAFRVLQRKANPLKLSLFSFIVRQHERTLEWLATVPFVDAARIGLYGISYGGKTAMRVPALLTDYCLSICSADYNEWIWKNVSNRDPYSYLFTGEYEMFEFDLGNTFNYAELSWLIFPRPIMVERGHHDGVAPDEWVAYEYARTYRHYDLLGLGDRSEIEFFDGPHCIHGVGTFAFLHKHLDWPAPTHAPD